ncbi:MAG: hypothetical protein ABIO16_16830 [Nocardioides sp.]
MTTLQQSRVRVRTSALAVWSLVGGGIAFFAGGAMHPKEDPPGITGKEHLHVMFQDPLWYPAHAVLLLGMLLMTVGLVRLVRDANYAGTPVGTALRLAAVASALGTGDMVLHLLAKLQDGAVAAGDTALLVDAHLVIESITVPLFGLAITWLAVTGARGRAFGNWFIAAFAVVGGVTYAVAAGTIGFTEALDALFPFAGLIGVWAVATGLWLRRSA